MGKRVARGRTPAQLQVFDDPGKALARANKMLGHVEERRWGAVATVPGADGLWTLAAFVGRPSWAKMVAGGYAERTISGVPVGVVPVMLVSALAGVGLSGLVPGGNWTALVVPFALFGFFLGVPIGALLRWLAARTLTTIELDDDLRLLPQLEREGLLGSDRVRQLLLLAARGDRELVLAATRKAHEVLTLGRPCPAEMGIPAAVDDLLELFAADPGHAWPSTSAALDELGGAVQAWRQSRLQLEQAADEPVRRLRGADEQAAELERQARARTAIGGVLDQLATDAAATRGAAAELDDH